jgi:hypothetical protein
LPSYTRLRFGNGSISAEKLNAIIGNTDYLYENMVRGYHNVFGNPKETNLKVQGILCLPYHYQDVWQRTADIYWPKPFSPGCTPVITNSHYMNAAFLHAIAIAALDLTVFPNNVGFKMHMVATQAATSSWGDQWQGDHWVPVIGLGF